VSFAADGAVPGDRIVGILTPGQGITIYPIHAEALKAFDEEPERWIDVTWDIDEDNPQRFPAKIAVTALNEPGSLAQVAAVIGEADGNIDNIKIMKQVPDYAEMVIELEVWDLTHLNEILAGLRAKDVVSRAQRVGG
jgi:(p)ppGpp synthase/HD superfamily hydrolase